jgi:hypothetical protein
MKKTKANITTGSAEEFFRRVRQDAERLDRGQAIPAKINITFEDPADC